jgi:hypothetical protein
MKKLMWAALGLLLFVVPSRAQSTPAVDAAVGYSYLHVGGTGFNGVSGSLAYNLNHVVGAVGDLGVVHAEGTTITSYTFGPRFSYRSYDKVTPFFEVLFGGSHFAEGVNPFTYAIEGGADLDLSRDGSVGLRPEMGYMGFHENGSTLNGFRFGLSIVFHIGER